MQEFDNVIFSKKDLKKLFLLARSLLSKNVEQIYYAGNLCYHLRVIQINLLGSLQHFTFSRKKLKIILSF